jgi:hypothetical protein
MLGKLSRVVRPVVANLIKGAIVRDDSVIRLRLSWGRFQKLWGR